MMSHVHFIFMMESVNLVPTVHHRLNTGYLAFVMGMTFTVALMDLLRLVLTHGVLRVDNLESADPPVSVLPMLILDPFIGLLGHAKGM